jgi:hypothetical protein
VRADGERHADHRFGAVFRLLIDALEMVGIGDQRRIDQRFAGRIHATGLAGRDGNPVRAEFAELGQHALRARAGGGGKIKTVACGVVEDDGPGLRIGQFPGSGEDRGNEIVVVDLGTEFPRVLDQRKQVGRLSSSLPGMMRSKLCTTIRHCLPSPAGCLIPPPAGYDLRARMTEFEPGRYP